MVQEQDMQNTHCTMYNVKCTLYNHAVCRIQALLSGSGSEFLSRVQIRIGQNIRIRIHEQKRPQTVSTRRRKKCYIMFSTLNTILSVRFLQNLII